MALTVETGCYSFEWKGGTFDVEFRPDGVFWCKKFPAEAHAVEGERRRSSGKFGKYELRADGGNPKSLVGAVARPSIPTTGGRQFLRAFTPQEALLSGSSGSCLRRRLAVPRRVPRRRRGARGLPGALDGTSSTATPSSSSGASTASTNSSSTSRLAR